MKVVVTGGGSGGHIYPALAVSEAMRSMDPAAEISYIGGAAGMEARIVPEAGWPFVGVATRKLTKVFSPRTIGVLLALLRGYREASAYLRRWKPDVALGTGGYVAAATILAAAKQNVPTVILSPDAVAGRTNRWLSRWARKICLWLGPDQEFPAGKIIRTGLPIRPEVVDTVEPEDARKALGLAERFTVLVIGGSQGAQRVNELVLEATSLLPDGIQVLHQTGERNYEDVVNAARGRTRDTGHFIRPYLSGEDLPRAYRAADLLICRSGVGMLAEGTANGLPLLMIPLPTAYADHQTHNARAIERGGGGVLLPQPQLTGEALARQIMALRDDHERLKLMASASRAQGRRDAAAGVAQLLRDLM